jgi:ABC transporter substrate binding protein
VKRREFITLLGGTAVSWPLAARAQQHVHVVGVLASQLLPPLQRFERKLREYGHMEGENVRFVPRFAEGRDDRQRIGQFAATTRLILVGLPRWLIEVRAVLTFGPNVAELHQRASVYLHKILKGAKPADLPMQQPTTFELTINLKVAKSLGLIVPPTVIARADEVIE